MFTTILNTNLFQVYHDSKNQSGETYPSSLTSDETFVVPDKFLRKYGIRQIRYMDPDPSGLWVWIHMDPHGSALNFSPESGSAFRIRFRLPLDLIRYR